MSSNTMSTDTQDDRSARSRWAAVLLCALMIAGAYRRAAIVFKSAPRRWAAHVYRCGAMIITLLRRACCRHGRKEQAIFATRPGRSGLPSHRAQTRPKQRAGASYGYTGGGLKTPLAITSSWTNSIIIGSSRPGPMSRRPAGNRSPVTPIGAAVADRYDRGERAASIGLLANHRADTTGPRARRRLCRKPQPAPALQPRHDRPHRERSRPQRPDA